jgi:hypothetical protein
LEVTNFGKKEGGGGKGIPAPRGSGGRGDGNQAGGVVAKKEAGGAGLGKDPAEVGVAGAVADIKEDGAGKGGGAVGGGGDLGPEDGMEAGFPGGEEEVNGGVEVGVSEADGGEVEFGRSGHNGLDRKEGVVKAVVGADVEGGVGGHEVLYKCIMRKVESEKRPSVAPNLEDSGGAMEGGRGAAESGKNEGISGLGVSDGGKLGDFGFGNSVALTGLARIFTFSQGLALG